jgi:putative addiction module component (TIGR02574 family)
MTEAVNQLKSRAITLSAPERADLAYFLLSTLDAEEEGGEEAWRTEIARRVAEIRSGSAAGRSAEEVLAELRERYP